MLADFKKDPEWPCISISIEVGIGDGCGHRHGYDVLIPFDRNGGGNVVRIRRQLFGTGRNIPD
jgi:hypothetical protein